MVGKSGSVVGKLRSAGSDLRASHRKTEQPFLEQIRDMKTTDKDQVNVPHMSFRSRSTGNWSSSNLLPLISQRRLTQPCVPNGDAELRGGRGPSSGRRYHLVTQPSSLIATPNIDRGAAITRRRDAEIGPIPLARGIRRYFRPLEGRVNPKFRVNPGSHYWT
ncbi:hypothetical protein U1Q18_004518 [Sarracenia purpurea var. burkii]